MTKLKMYVWEGVLCDWTCGMVAILAESKEAALKLAEEKLDDYEFDDIKSKEPDIYDQPKVVKCWGGG